MTDAEAEDDEAADGDEKEETQPQLNPAARLASKKVSPIFGGLLRSKGFVWLATRPVMYGEWSQGEKSPAVVLVWLLTPSHSSRRHAHAHRWRPAALRGAIRRLARGRGDHRRHQARLLRPVEGPPAGGEPDPSEAVLLTASSHASRSSSSSARAWAPATRRPSPRLSTSVCSPTPSGRSGRR